ncbi:DNA methyltransferase family protein [Paraliomyxa miuraensis]|uniref:hypothetical protein n=1 Tax=Paraliomyxa miuraensis TaxID=376150 RepID=UPI00225854CA|nr:hypothetical protein [Paraliomyxa miuraensis]MCX4247537.1 hypothetical protein [Paraliomyxa miuraensis]
MKPSVRKAAFGDFQTPRALADRVCTWLVRRGVRPATVMEPTCGTGTFLLAAAEAFEGATLRGRELDPGHAREARARLAAIGHRRVVTVGDFFTTSWTAELRRCREPILVLGNPPWVTSAELSTLGVDNLPSKSNLKALPGLAAKTGASNFDVSEWMLLHLLQLAQGRDVTIAMLVKTAVARRVLEHAARTGLMLEGACMVRIDAQAEFGAAVDAGLLVGSTRRRPREPGSELELTCTVLASLDDPTPRAELAIRDGRLIADASAYDRARRVIGRAVPPWRSGVKHDCAKVMELRRDDRGRFVNGWGQPVEIERERRFDLLKSSDLRGDDRPSPRRWLVLPQRALGEDTTALARTAPRVWRYLLAHAEALDARKSSIYRGQPRFCVFGVGEYSFAPWKVAISGLYKRAAFTLVGPGEDGRPVLLDDTCYFLGFAHEAEARAACWLLRSEPAQDVMRALTFWDAKRPITKELLDRLDLRALAVEALRASPPRALRGALRSLRDDR